MGLRRYVVARLLLTVPILFGVSVVTFALVQLTPGDPVSRIVALNPDVSAAEAERLRRRYGLARPVWEQYVDWLTGVLQGDFGTVVGSGRDVRDVVLARLPATVALGLFGWGFALAVALPAGIYAAVRKDRLGDHVSRAFALSGVSVPNFWLGLLVLLAGTHWLGLWPVLPPREPLYHPATLWYLVMPGLTIGTAAAATLTRITRTAVAEELHSDYVTAARARGLPERTILRRHVLPNALLPVTTVAAFLSASLLAGAVVVEVVFDWPGLGRALVDAVVSREVDLVLAITLIAGVAIVLANLLADLCYALLDPRIRYD